MNTIFNKNSLFWKIFLAFWLANFLMILATSYFTLLARDSADARQKKQEIAEKIGQRIINQWESTNATQTPFKFKADGIRVKNAAGIFLFNEPLTKKESHYLVFDYQSPSNKNYKIYLPAKSPKRHMGRHLQKTLGLRLLIIFIISGLVSYILSKIITTPLKRLGKQTQLIANNNLDKTIEPNLLNRKDEIGELARDFDDALNNISALINSKQTLLHDVSHELRAPLARLMASVGLLEQDSLQKNDGKASSMLNRIELECNNMNELIDQILKLSRVESTEPKKNKIDIITLLHTCITDTQFEYPQHPIVFNPSDNNNSIMINADSSMLATAFNNILRNGCQHTDAGTQIDILTKKEDQYVKIIIKDNGKGLLPSEIDNIFKPFFRMHNSGDNFGLGLNITQRMIEKHHGSIKAYSEENEGLTFIITLPFL